MNIRSALFFVFCLACLQSEAQTYPEMIQVAGGRFAMGNKQRIGELDELPVHQVTLKTFSMAKTETTVTQWKAYWHAKDEKMTEEIPDWSWTDEHPIVNISRDEAVAYCHWLSDKTGNLYRLPTEAEWEYAARGGQLSKGFTYSGGKSLPTVGWYYDNSKGSTNAVAQKLPNELGLYDMSGNVWEWCQDWYGEYSSHAQTNPTGAVSGDNCVLRGGGWDYPATACRVARRARVPPGSRDRLIGFRVVLVQ